MAETSHGLITHHSSLITPPSVAEMRRVVEMALAEDLAWGDVTTEAVVGAGRPARGDLLVKGEGVLAGLPVAALVFAAVDPSVIFAPLVADGTPVTPGMTVAQVTGPAGSLLKAERVALNLLQRLSGVASVTRPLRRRGERHAGAHRRHAQDDAGAARAGEVRRPRRRRRTTTASIWPTACSSRTTTCWPPTPRAVARRGDPARPRARRRTRCGSRSRSTTLEQLDAALDGGRRHRPARQHVGRAAARGGRRASRPGDSPRPRGGITLATVRAVAETGVDLISVGALTHSAPALDISLDLYVD